MIRDHEQVAPMTVQRQAFAAGELLPFVIGAGILAVLWFVKFADSGLWYDELQSVTLAGRPLVTSIFSVIVYDPHPPLYYVLLHFWMLFGQSDGFILASSLALMVSTAVVINVHCRRYYDRATAMVAPLIFLVHPYTFYWSGQARMYAAVMLFAILCQHANAGYFLAQEKKGALPRLIWIVIFGAALASLHNSGILFSGTIALYWLLRHRMASVESGPSARLAPWLVAQGFVVLLSLPFVVHSLLEHLGHTERPNFIDLVAAFASMTIGPEQLHVAPMIAGALATLIVLALAARSADLRLTGGILILFPILVFWVISNLVKPIWIADRLFAFLVPFFCIIAASVLTSRARWSVAGGTVRGRGLALAAGVLLTATVIAGDRQILDSYVKPTDWRRAAELVKSAAPDGATVETNNVRDRWSINWYLLGPEWDRGIQGAFLEALHRAGPNNPIKRLTMIRDAMESYETEKSHGKYVVESALADHGQSSQPVFAFTQHCPASEFWNIFLADPKREPNPDFLSRYQPLPPIKGICGYVSQAVVSGITQ
jgi:hypothetical protein